MANTIRQHLLPIAPGHSVTETIIPVRHYSARYAGEAARSLVRSLKASHTHDDPIAIGVSIRKNTSGSLDFIVFSTPDEIIDLSFDNSTAITIPDKDFVQLVSGNTSVVFEGPFGLTTTHEVVLVSFQMPQVAIFLQKAFGVRIQGVDLGMLFSPSTFSPRLPGKVIASKMYHNVDQYEVNMLWYGDDQGDTTACLRAWVSSRIGASCAGELRLAKKVDTRFLNRDETERIYTLCLESEILDQAKPRETPNEFNSFKLKKDGKLQLENSRYRTRVRRSNHTQVIMTNESGTEYIGRASHAKGKTTTIRLNSNTSIYGAVKSVRVVGKQEPTNSEKAQSELLLLLLWGEKDLRTSPFTRIVWFPKWKYVKQAHNADCGELGRSFLSEIELNPSQRRAAMAMISKTPLVVTHGAPGTGKTTTIAAAAKVWDSCGKPTWIVAHSNVAVKNIAESLYKRSIMFILLVSKEFYEEWHEHLYTGIERCLIRSDELPEDKAGMDRLFRGSKIVLSTLSMLSNPALETNGTFDLVPVERLVIDEASQIRIFEFMHIFVKFQKDLMKVCFFGDPKQLPPYGIENAPNMQTVFNLEHILKKDTSFFLDTQYRMPLCLGEFISNAIYESKLKSDHEVRTSNCLKFVDVGIHSEEVKDGFSWKNPGEVQMIVQIVRTYYRYKNFCVLSPYDAQRAAIERQLKAEDLPWETVYNVDSFQGNEADYVIVSVVRSGSPGFLQSDNRMNVLLTRCRQGLVIVTNRSFIKGRGASTLLGRLCRYWENKMGPTCWTTRLDILNSTVNLPGVPAPPKIPIQPRRSSPPKNSNDYRLSTWKQLQPAPMFSIYVGRLAISANQLHASHQQHTVTYSSPVYEQAFPSLSQGPVDQTIKQREKYSKVVQRNNSYLHSYTNKQATTQSPLHNGYNAPNHHYNSGFPSARPSTSTQRPERSPTMKSEKTRPPSLTLRKIGKKWVVVDHV